jgi:regulator of RNase E activity RraA
VIDGICSRHRSEYSASLPDLFSWTLDANRQRSGASGCEERNRLDGGVQVDAGDYLLGDGDGVVAIPAPRIDEVLATATEIDG